MTSSRRPFLRTARARPALACLSALALLAACGSDDDSPSAALPEVGAVTTTPQRDSDPTSSDAASPTTVATDPPATDAPATDPPATDPPATDPPVDLEFGVPDGWAMLDNQFDSTTFSADGDRAIALSNQRIDVTTDGVDWVGSDPESVGPAGMGLARGHRAHVLSNGFAVTTPTTVWFSADGAEWTGPTEVAGGEVFLRDVARTERQTWIVGSVLFDRGLLLRSESLAGDPSDTWDEIALPGAAEASRSSYDTISVSGPKLVVVGQLQNTDELTDRTPSSWWSDDGDTWNRSDVTGDFIGRGGVLNGVVWNPELGRYIAAGWDGVGDQEQRAIVLTSTDGVEWVQVLDGNLDAAGVDDKLIGITATPNGFFAVGRDEYAEDPFGILWSSDDGLVWQRAQIGDESFFAAGWSGDACLAGGDGTTYAGPCDSLTAS